ncbi:MAG TPA: GspH/FimT family pseudopilin [Methylomirabilota bacterium]|nr:GspH/FimT family pseudopilin [Methylomirabilota bacterium]
MRRGYTLIEAVVVLFVLALAAAVAGPSIERGLGAVRLRAEVAGVASFLRAARERAISQHTALDVDVDRDGRTLVLKASAAESGKDGEAVRAVRRLSFVRVEVDPSRARTVTFYAYGLSSGGHFRLEALRARSATWWRSTR